MILIQGAAELLSKLDTWAKDNHVTDEAWQIIDMAVSRLARTQARATSDDAGDVAKTLVGELLTCADSFGYSYTAETAFRELGYGHLIPPASGPFNVTFAGVTLRLVLPINRKGQPYGVHGALADAISDASFVPASDVSADVLPEVSPESTK